MPLHDIWNHSIDRLMLTMQRVQRLLEGKSFLSQNNLQIADHAVLERYGRSQHVELPSEFSAASWNIQKSAQALRERRLWTLIEKTLSRSFQKINQNDIVLWHERVHSVLTDTHIIALQECELHEPLKTVLAGLAETHDVALAQAILRGGHTPSGIATASVAEHNDLTWHRSDTRELVTNAAKMALYSTYQLEGSHLDLAFVNLHLSIFTTREQFKGEIAKVIHHLHQHPGPFIVLGDFNTWQSWRVEFLHEAIRKLGGEHVIWDHKSWRKTWNGNPLDHAFYRGLNLLHAQARRASDLKKIFNESDHGFLKIRFSAQSNIQML